MLKKLWQWLGTYSNHLVGLLALLTIFTIGARPVLRWLSGKPLIVTVQRSESTVPPDLLAWSKGLASNLPYIISGLRQRSGDIQTRKPSDRNSWDNRLFDSIASEDKNWSDSLRPYSDWERSKMLEYAGDHNLSRLTLTLQNPSSSEMRRIRINVTGIQNLWDVFAEGTFLSKEEVSAIQTGAIKSWDQVALPEIKSLPPGGTIKVSFYGTVGPWTKTEVTAEDVDVKMVEMLMIEKNWFLSLYQISSPIIYVVLFIGALIALPWAIQRVTSGAQSPTPDAGISQATPEPESGQKGADPAPPIPK